MKGFSDEDETDNDSEMGESEEDILSEDEEDLRISKGVKAIKKQPNNRVVLKKKDDGEINMDSVEPWMLDDEDDGDMLLQEPKKVDLNKMNKKNNNKKNEKEGFEDDFYKQVKSKQSDDKVSKKK